MRWACYFLLFCLPISLMAQTENPVGGAASEGMAGLGVAVPGSWALQHNPALLPIKVKNQVQTSIRLWPQLPDLTSLALLGTYSLTADHALGASINRFGFGPLSQQQIRLGWGHKIGLFGLGIATILSQTALEGYSSRRTISIDAGTYASLFPSVTLAAAVANLPVSEVRDNGNRTTLLRLRIGASWQLNDKLLLSSELDKHQEFPTRLHVGMAYQLHKRVAARLGVATRPSQFSAGLGFQLRSFTFDYGTSYQETFGLIHQLSFGLNLEK